MRAFTKSVVSGMIFQTRIINYEEGAQNTLYTFLNKYGTITQKLLLGYTNTMQC
jgi:hypothetical protein